MIGDIHTVRYWSIDEPTPAGWIESVPASDMGHHGAYSRIIRKIEDEPEPLEREHEIPKF